ncbi:MAG: glycerol-3-phosphate dehydrogenase/oxidase [Halieaceae bacterium]|jgi:glycerol-3-phosphate dehydrogenase|nr:glycerol-3-phosphate dehydrogenase/oxidase [Halieaceae bacterium]
MNTENPSFNRRQTLWQAIQDGDKNWDMVIVGGGIIGAGILREAARRGLKALLVEQRDFAWGTSSRSSKMVHGGLRYIAQGDIRLTRHSLSERERLIVEAPGLIERMGYYFTLRKGQFPGRFLFSVLLSLYDALAGIRNHRYFNKAAVEKHFPGLNCQGLKGAVYYTDTVTDDARLVLRVLQSAIEAGGLAMNYVRADSLIREGGSVCGVRISDVEGGGQLEIRSKSVINATGAWADRLRNEINPEVRVRPLRGSHLVIPMHRLPVADALTLLHPVDKRPVFIFPWEGSTVIGTTDLDHKEDIDAEPGISVEELNYLLAVVEALFPEHGIGRDDVISSYSGVRPVICSDKSRDPSKERRDHAVWSDEGLVTVAGGKLTTFRLIALDAIAAATPNLGNLASREPTDTVFPEPRISAGGLNTADKKWAQRLIGRYGDCAKPLLYEASDAERRKIGSTEFCLAECRWAARNESVIHLDDLLLRRTRLGSLLERGGEALFPVLEEICEEELGWDGTRWQGEVARYRDIWHSHYYLPDDRA